MSEYHVSRGKTLFTRAVILSVLGASGLALVLTGNGGLNDFLGGDANVAVIGDKRISTTELGTLYNHALAQGGLNDAMARQMGFPSMVLQREIDRQVMLQAAEKSGIRVDNAYVAKQLARQLDQLTLPGTRREKLQLVLEQQKITEPQLVDLLRGDYAGGMLAGVSNPPTFKPLEALTLAQYHAARETRIADVIPLGPGALQDAKPLSAADFKTYFDEHKENYRQPENRDFDVLVLPQSVFAVEAPVSDADAHAFYDSHKNDFSSSERVRLEQIVAESEEAAKKIIAANPASLADIKQEGVQVLKADWYGKTNLPKEFSASLYPDKKTGLIGPIKTAVGWHVLHVTAYDDAKPLDFATARQAVDKAVTAERLDAQMTAFTDDIDKMLAANAGLTEIAEKYKLAILPFKAVQKADAAKQMKDVATPIQQRAAEAAFDTNDGETSPLLDTTDGDYLLVHVNKVNPSAVASFDNVKERVMTDAAKADRSKNMTDLSEKLIGAFDAANPQKFEDMLKQRGIVANTTKAVAKDDFAKTNGKQAAELLFTLSPANALSYVQTDDGVTLLRLRRIVADTAAPDADAIAGTDKKVMTDIAQELQQQFGEALRQQVKVKVDMNVLQAAFSSTPAEPGSTIEE